MEMKVLSTWFLADLGDRKNLFSAGNQTKILSGKMEVILRDRNIP